MLESLATVWNKHLEEGVLRIPQCSGCHAWNWYPVPVCKHCHGSEFSWERVPTEGALYGATRMHRNFTGLDIGEVPYIVGLVEPRGIEGVRLTCRYLNTDDRVLPVGEHVTIKICQGAQGFYLGFQ